MVVDYGSTAFDFRFFKVWNLEFEFQDLGVLGLGNRSSHHSEVLRLGEGGVVSGNKKSLGILTLFHLERRRSTVPLK